MATLQKIRNRGPLLLIVIGLALLAFILGDAWKMIRPNQNVVLAGEIDGKSVSAMDYQDELEKYSEIIKFSMGVTNLTDEQYTAVKDEVWTTMVRNSILKKETDAIGLMVTDLEVQSVIEKGTDPVLENTPFRNEKTGAFDVDYLKQFLAGYKTLNREDMSPENLSYYDNLYNYWLYIEDNIKMSLLYQKYASLVEGSILSNPVSIKNSYETRIKRADVLFATIPFFEVADSLVKVGNSDLKKLYDEKKEFFKQSVESRDIVYIDYEIMPSAADREETMKELTDFSSQLSNTNEDFASFIRLTESVVPYSEVPRTASSLPSDVVVRLDSVKMGDTYGPYYNASDDSYNAFKLLSKIEAYDSIQYCLIQVARDTEEKTASLSDSIYQAVKGGADFAEVASKYAQKGEPQWISSENYEKEALSGANAVFLNKLNGMKKGEITNLKVENSNLIIKVLDTKKSVAKYDVAVIKRIATFSPETSNDAYNKLSSFVAANNTVDSLEANSEKNNYRLLTIEDFQSFQNNVGDVAKSHEALRWAYDAQVGDVSKIFEVGEDNNHLLVVGLNAIHKKGYRSLEDVKSKLMPLAIREKKAELLINKLKSAKTMEEVLKVDGVLSDTIQYVNFTTPAFITLTYSNEPAIGPSVFNLKEREMTAPIKGEGGVFVAEKITPDTLPVEFDKATEKSRMKAMYASTIANQILQELYLNANVEDIRYKTF